MDWLTSHWGSLLTVVTSVISAASVVAKITPTQTDDLVIATILKVVDLLAFSREIADFGTVVDLLALNNKPTELKK